MKKILLFALLNCTAFSFAGDIPGCHSINAGADVCANPCATLTATVADIPQLPTSYAVASIPYSPFTYIGGTPVLVGQDDLWSDPVQLGFNFCYFGNTFTQAAIGANGEISFSQSSKAGEYYIINEGIPSSSLSHPKNTICAAYRDIDPSKGGSITVQTLGTAPCRTLVISWINVPLFNSNGNKCKGLSSSTFQLVLYETSNFIDVYIQNSSSCWDWNGGFGIIGLQNGNNTVAVTPPNRNFPSTWNAVNEAWRFSPTGSQASVSPIVWTGPNGIVGTGPSVTICPTVPTTYTATATFTTCGGDVMVMSDQVTVQPPPIPGFTVNPSFCAGQAITANGTASKNCPNSFWEIAQCSANGTVTTGGYLYSAWTGMIPGVYTFPVTPPCGKYYRIKLASYNYCGGGITESTKIIYISCNPTVTVSGPTAVCASSGAILTANGANSYVWSAANQTASQIIVHPKADCPSCGTNGQSTIYTVTGKNSYGCSSTGSIAVLPLAQNLYIDISTGVGISGNPSALIPYGSGDADWRVRGLANAAPYTSTFANLASATVVKPFQGTTWVNSSSESWITSKAIGVNPDPTPPATDLTLLPDNYWYENRFTIPDVGYTNLSVNINEASADDNGSVYLNSATALTSNSAQPDVLIQNNGGATFKYMFGPFAINTQSKFKVGENVLLVRTINQTQSSYTPTGFIMRGTVSGFCPIVEPCLTPVISIAGNAIICPGNPSVTLSITQYSSGSIQWEKQECGDIFTTISGATGSSYVVTSGNLNGTNYRAKILCNGLPIYSNILQVHQLAYCNQSPALCFPGMKLKDPRVEEKSIATTNLYPNPFSSNFTVVSGVEGEVKIDVMDLLGKIIVQTRGNAKEEINLQMNEAPSGIYLVKISADGNTIVKKIIKE